MVSPSEYHLGFARCHRTLTSVISRVARNYPAVVTFAINAAVTTRMCARNAPKIFVRRGGPDCANRKTGQCCRRRCPTRCRLIDLGVTRVHADLISTFDVQSDITPWFNSLATLETGPLGRFIRVPRVTAKCAYWAQKAHRHNRHFNAQSLWSAGALCASIWINLQHCWMAHGSVFLSDIRAKPEVNLSIFSYDKNDNFNILYRKRARARKRSVCYSLCRTIRRLALNFNESSAIRITRRVNFVPPWHTRSLNNFLHP